MNVHDGHAHPFGVECPAASQVDNGPGAALFVLALFAVTLLLLALLLLLLPLLLLSLLQLLLVER